MSCSLGKGEAAGRPGREGGQQHAEEANNGDDNEPFGQGERSQAEMNEITGSIRQSLRRPSR